MLLASTSCFRGYGLHKIFKIIKESSYEGVNLDMISGEFDTEDAEYLKELSIEFNLPIVSITAYERKMDKKIVDDILIIAKNIGAKIVNFYPPHRADKDTTWFSDYLPKLKEKTKDIQLSIINVEPKTFLFFIPEYKDATLSTIKKITGETTLAISNVDPSTGVDLLKTLSMLGDSNGSTVKNIFLSDKAGVKQDLSLGKGDMPLESFLIKLKDKKYSGIFTLKISSKEIGVGNIKTILKKMEENKKYFEKYFIS